MFYDNNIICGFSGIDPKSLRGSNTGFFLGCNVHNVNMQSFLIDKGRLYHPFVTCVQSNINFDFHGPTLTVDTACASSFTALNQAVIAFKTGKIKFR
jgi:acyl transferase domain-containing protein